MGQRAPNEGETQAPPQWALLHAVKNTASPAGKSDSMTAAVSFVAHVMGMNSAKNAPRKYGGARGSSRKWSSDLLGENERRD